MSWNAAGIGIEILGAAWLLVASWNASRAMRPFPAKIDYNNFAKAIETLADIQRGQFRDQACGFAALAIGLGLQLFA